MTLDKPKTSFSFQATPGSNSLLFFSFLFSCLLSEGGGKRRRRRKSASPLQCGHCVKFLFHTLWAGYQRPHPALPVRSLWDQIPWAEVAVLGPRWHCWGRGGTAGAEMALLGLWDESWEWQSCCCPPGGSRCPSGEVLVAQGGFGGLGVAGTTPSSSLWPLRGPCHVWLW